MNAYIAKPPNHLLELALHTARKGGWETNRFVVPHTPEAERFGVPPGRYFIAKGTERATPTAYRCLTPGDLLLR